MTLKQFQKKGGKSRSPKKVKAARKNVAKARKALRDGDNQMQCCEG
jgi:ribosomal protein L29